MSKTPESIGRKYGPDRVALLTGTYKRPKPYESSSARRRIVRTGDETGSGINNSLCRLPATTAVLAAMRTPPKPSTPHPMVKPTSAVGIDLSMSIKRAAIDWKLANKEAEVFKLKTDIHCLESQINSQAEHEQEVKILHEKELATSELEKQQLQSRVRSLEQEVENQKRDIISLKQVEHDLQTAFLPEKESLEKVIIDLKINDCDLRAKLADAEQEVKSAGLRHESEQLKLKHEIRCLNLELDSVRTSARLLQDSISCLKKEVSELSDLQQRFEKVETENRSLKSRLQSYEESAELRRIFSEDMEELKRLRHENLGLRSAMEEALPGSGHDVLPLEEDSELPSAAHAVDYEHDDDGAAEPLAHEPYDDSESESPLSGGEDDMEQRHSTASSLSPQRRVRNASSESGSSSGRESPAGDEGESHDGADLYVDIDDEASPSEAEEEVDAEDDDIAEVSD